MGDRFEAFERGSADALGGRFRGDEVRVLFFEGFELVEELVVGLVGDLGTVADVVEVVVVVDLGAEPRQELRYRFDEGQTGTLGMEMTIDLVNTMDGTQLLDTTMLMLAEADTTVTEVYEDGSVRVEQVFTKYEFADTGDPAADAELAAASEQVVGLAMWSIIDDRGTLIDSYGLASVRPA